MGIVRARNFRRKLTTKRVGLPPQKPPAPGVGDAPPGQKKRPKGK